MRRLPIAVTGLLLIVALAATPALAGSGPGAHAAALKRVSVKDDFFGPKTVRIHRGTTVRWVWRGSNPHNVRGGGTHSRTKTSGTYSHRFRRKGTYRIYCSIHRGLGMKMTVRVG